LVIFFVSFHMWYCLDWQCINMPKEFRIWTRLMYSRIIVGTFWKMCPTFEADCLFDYGAWIVQD
jgi:hypothetical protein